jgi:O-antigen/teichoic acid export membrane protein
VTPAASSNRIDRSTAWVATASVVLGTLDALSTILCLQLGVTTAELGIATIATALFPILDRLGGMGLCGAMVREPDTDPVAQSTVFWVGIGAALALCAVLAAAWPLVGAILPASIVGALLLAYAARLLVRQFAVVPEAMLKRDLRYRELSVVRMAGMLAETATKLGFAYAGTHGGPRELAVWCFILGPIANALVTTIGILGYYRWRPRLLFSRTVARRAAGFTASISAGELLYFAYTSADYLVVGALFGDAAVGAYRLAYELVIDVVRMMSLVTTEVAFPTFVRLAKEPRAVADQLLRFTRQNLILLAPFLVYVAIEADDLLVALFAVLPPAAATAARVLCIVGALRTLGFILPAMLAGVGQPGRVLVYNAFAAVLLPLAFIAAGLAAPGQSYVGIAWAWALGYPCAFVVLLAMALPHAGLRLATYLRALVGIAVCTAGAGAAGVAVRLALPTDIDLTVRTLAVAAAVIAVYAALLARIEHVTVASVARSLRGRK